MTKAIDHNRQSQTNTIEYSYNSFSQITKEIQNDKEVSTLYDEILNPIEVKYDDNHSLYQSFDESNNLKHLQYNDIDIAYFKYNKDNQVIKEELFNGIDNTISYDQSAREIKREYNNIYKEESFYDKNSNIIQEKIYKNNQNIEKSYEYDAKDRVKKDSYNSHYFQYDLVGNITKTNQNGYEEIRVVNKDNEYISITDTKIRHDANGNLIEYGNKKYEYDYLNRLVSYKEDNNTIANYTYDAQNRRVKKQLVKQNKTISYLYNKNQVVQEYENDILSMQYIYSESIDDPIAFIKNNKTYFYLKDRQGSIIAITDKNGNTVESYSYNSFGKIEIKDQNGQVILKSNYNNAYTYTGRRLDSESGLYYYRNRMYSAELGRFLSEDPKGFIDGYNLYAYVRNVIKLNCFSFIVSKP
ncbi:MAG: RHS repeat-associated core domain-containing protein [Arcobacter sp.]|nr:RHS repeat-associated core domain-containing protein [Arcobacter sp.]